MQKIYIKVKDIFTKEIDIKNLVNIILYSVIIIMPFIVVNISSPRYVVGKLIFLYIIGIISMVSLIKLKVAEFSVEHKIALVFLLTMLIPSILSKEKYVAFMGNITRGEGFIIYCIYIILFILASKYLILDKKILDIILISACIMASYGVVQFYSIDPVQYWMLGYISVGDSIGLIGNRNFFSSYLCIFLFISMAIYIFNGGRKYLIYSIILFSALICTLTRSGWLAFFIYSIIGFILIFKDIKKIKRAGKIFLLFCGIFLLINISSGGKVFSRANNTISIDEKGNRKIQDSGRIEILKISWKAFIDSPFIGWGPDTLSYRLDSDYHKSYQEYLENHGAYIDKSHNEYLEYAVSNGILNLITYLALIGVILYKLIKNFNNNISKTLFLTLIGYLVQSFFNISVVMVAPIFWIFLGICINKNTYNLSQ